MKLPIKHIAFLTLLFVLISCQDKSTRIDLAGKWKFRIDSLDLGEEEEWFKKSLEDTISLPGSMAENGKGHDIDLHTHWTANMWNDSLWYKGDKYAEYRQPGNIKISSWLSPEKKYYGAAWYQKIVNIPKDWNEKNVFLDLERAHWETTLWIDGQKVGAENLLATPHRYNLTDLLSPGKHRISIRVDNRIKDINVGKDAHSISDNTQSNWNGLIGDLHLVAKPKVYIDLVRVKPDVTNREVEVIAEIINTSNSSQVVELKLSAKNIEGVEVGTGEIQKKYSVGKSQTVSISYPMGDSVELWDEFNPNVYEMNLKLNSKQGEDSKKVRFGMREFKANGKHFAINGRPVFLRGTLESAIFPKTGYPSTKKEDWAKIFDIIKDHGLNHVRFHSWCPPEAAFDAADEAGIYLQVEASAWTVVGDGKPIDQWLYKEAQAILDAYGNHPSFVMMAHGNEPSGDNHIKYLIDFVDHFKSQDNTKVYTSGAGYPYIENADYWNTPKPRIQQWNQNLNSIINREPPQTFFDYQEIIDSTSMPVVSHEIGQWCVYPNFKEMDKYTGVLKPKNFEIFKETLEDNHMGNLADSLMLASGKLQTLCYKAEIEAALRTKDFAGFQLLDLHDFPGQGTALVGVLDAFWDEKGYVTAKEFESFSGQTVPLVRLKQRTFKNTDTLYAKVEIAHFGKEILENVTPTWTLEFENGKTFAEGALSLKTVSIGNGIDLGEISVSLNDIDEASKLNLSVGLGDHINDWDIWVYPAEKPEISETDFRVVETLDAETIDYLENGGKVLLNPSKGAVVSGKGGDIAVGFSSIFWNTSWTNGQEPHTLGILCNPEHPALKEFPTDYHSNWQWWDAMNHSNAIVLDEFSSDLKPIVRIIDDWFENRRLALLFEAKVGKGKLLVSGVDLHTNLENRLEAQQLLYSLKKYISSKEFNPQNEVAMEDIMGIYVK
ncbi:Glycosyl hydrolases family 2, TIM barrel domain [Salegentibacter holothuriorum]|uniref:beta-galactosidase n=1 Tax=Salegentibacter holothuriorum TaxID=241145 RepID=A0A1T5EN45_9FLAO|nr:sugar-binding domain-containing protein [Salegentibacter holothuriorum]SKB85412.1 Glycosyl hydrolases family 2, TIM barrel domain [Salegentibacter holothuriorum]